MGNKVTDFAGAGGIFDWKKGVQTKAGTGPSELVSATDILNSNLSSLPAESTASFPSASFGKLGKKT